VQAALNSAQSGEWKAATQVSFVAKTQSVLPDLQTLSTGLDAQAAALNQYATQVQSIQDALQVVHTQHKNATTDSARALHSMPILPASHSTYESVSDWLNPTEKSMAPGGQRAFADDSFDDGLRRAHSWTQFDQAKSQLRHCDQQLTDLASQRRTADTVCVSALSSNQVLGRMTTITPASITAMNKTQQLALMGTLSAGDLHIFLTQNPALAQQFWNTPPDAAAVATWWTNLAPAEKYALTTGAAAIIGNLGGIDFASRITANNNQLAEFKTRTNLTPSQKDAIKQIEWTLVGATGKPGTLVDFNVSADPPLAAFAYGNLDTAQKVTWIIPGMGSKVSPGDTTPQVAQNLLDAQGFVDLRTSHAVIAWLGYRSPEMDESFHTPGSSRSVWENNLAQAGSKRLTAELDALHDTPRTTTDGQPIPPHIAVVAHSYGTTTVAYALHNTHFDVDSAVFVASAGIDKTVVPNEAAMNIATVDSKEQLYSTQAEADLVATIGRLPAVLIPSVGILNPFPHEQVPLSHRIYPDAEFGATPFSSEGGVDGKTSFSATSVHDAIGADGNVGHGYFDAGTESLRDVALSSTGHGGEIKHLAPLPLLLPPTRP